MMLNLWSGVPFHFWFGASFSPCFPVAKQYAINLYSAFMCTVVAFVRCFDSLRIGFNMSGCNHHIMCSSLPTPVRYFDCSFLLTTFSSSFGFTKICPASAGILGLSISSGKSNLSQKLCKSTSWVKVNMFLLLSNLQPTCLFMLPVMLQSNWSINCDFALFTSVVGPRTKQLLIQVTHNTNPISVYSK